MGIPPRFVAVYAKYNCRPPYHAPAPIFRMSLPQLLAASRDVASQHLKRGRHSGPIIPSGLIDVAVSVRECYDDLFSRGDNNEPLRPSAMDAAYKIKEEMRRYLARRPKR
jgi:hypothetical protein